MMSICNEREYEWSLARRTLRENILSDIPDCISLSFISFATNRLMAMFFVIGVHNKFLVLFI